MKWIQGPSWHDDSKTRMLVEAQCIYSDDCSLPEKGFLKAVTSTHNALPSFLMGHHSYTTHCSERNANSSGYKQLL